MESAFEKLLEDLVKAEVKFVTVGGVAVSLNGFLRLTEDVDILLAYEERSIRKTLEVISSCGEGYARELSVADFPLEEGAIRIIEESIGLQVDLFTILSGKSYDDFQNNILIFQSSKNIDIPYLDRDGLIYLKSDSGREKDQIDVSYLKKHTS